MIYHHVREAFVWKMLTWEGHLDTDPPYPTAWELSATFRMSRQAGGQRTDHGHAFQWQGWQGTASCPQQGTECVLNDICACELLGLLGPSE